MTLNGKYLLLTLFFALCTTFSYAQDLVEDISTPIETIGSEDLFTENIQIISRSRKIFIITNSNQMLSKGDFITLVLNFKDPVARALVAKNHEGLVGIKILKIYSLKNWSFIRQGLDVQILKGDDSSLFAPQEVKEEKPIEEVQIESAEDLFNEKDLLGDDLDSFGKENRHIKPDNLVNVFWARYSFKNTIKEETNIGNEFGGAWAYQFQDNFWIEAQYGRVMLNHIPSKNKQTLVNDFVLRLKYTIKTPLYTFILPYIGYQYYLLSSPEAGSSSNQTDDENETNLIKSLSKRQIVGGVTVLRRLVPGWFIKADLGTDIINLGFAIEF